MVPGPRFGLDRAGYIQIDYSVRGPQYYLKSFVAMNLQPTDVLLVEDNPSDVYLTQVAFRRRPSESQIHVVEDGIQAMAFLRREIPYNAAPRPDLVLLDLNLPRKDGYKVLEEMKADEELRKIPVIVLTTSTAAAAYAAGTPSPISGLTKRSSVAG